jgi:hypothetical protein
MACGSHKMQNIYTRIYIHYWTHFLEFIIYVVMVQADCNFGKLFKNHGLPKIVRLKELASQVLCTTSMLHACDLCLRGGGNKCVMRQI